MNGANGTLDFDVLIKTSDFKRQMDEIERRISQTNKRAAGEFDTLSASITNVGKAAGAYLGFSQLKGLATEIINVRGEFQQLGSAFNVMLGSKAKGDKLFQEAVQFAAKTPFTLQDVGKSAKQLLAYGTAAENVVSDLKTLGDVAAGVGAPIQDLVYLYGTLRTQGKAMTVDIRQFAGRGIPIYAELAKVLGVAKEKVAGMVEAGKVGFPQVEKAFQNMTREGGQFNNMMSEQAKSLTGLMSNLQDAISRMFNEIGKDQEGFIADGIKMTTELVNNYEEVVRVLGAIAVTYGTYRAALMLTSLATGELTIATTALNLVSKANPYVILATAIVAVGSAMYVLSDHTTKAERAQTLLNKAQQNADKTIAELTEKTGGLNKEEKKRITILETTLLLETELALLRRNEKNESVNKTNNGNGLGIGATNFFSSGNNLAISQGQENVNTLKRRLRKLLTEKDTIANSPNTPNGGGSGVGAGTQKSKAQKEAEKELEALKKAGKEMEDWQNISLNEYQDYLSKKTEALASFLASQKGSNEQLIALEEKYQGYIDTLNKEYENQEDETYKRKLERIETAKQAEMMANTDVAGAMEKIRDAELKREKDIADAEEIAIERKKKQFESMLDFASQLGEMLGLGKYAGGIANVAGAIKSGKNVGFSVASFGLDVAGDVISQIQKQRKEKEAYYESVTELQRKYNLELNNQLLLENKSSLIGAITKEYDGNFKLIKKVTEDFKKVISDLERPTRAGQQSVNSPLNELKKRFPKLFDVEGNINLAIAKDIVASNTFSSINNELNALIDLQTQINASKASIDQLTTSIGGSLEGTLRNTLVKAFEDGSDAALSFGGDVSNVLEDITSQILFQAVFAESFKKLKEDLDIAFKNGDNDLSQEFGALLAGNGDRITQFNNGLAQAQAQGAAVGLNLFSGSSGSNDQLSGSIKGVSEQTAGVLAGQMNAMRITQSLINSTLTSGLEYWKQTANNTAEIKKLMGSGSGLRANGIL